MSTTTFQKIAITFILVVVVVTILVERPRSSGG